MSKLVFIWNQHEINLNIELISCHANMTWDWNFTYHKKMACQLFFIISKEKLLNEYKRYWNLLKRVQSNRSKARKWINPQINITKLLFLSSLHINQDQTIRLILSTTLLKYSHLSNKKNVIALQRNTSWSYHTSEIAEVEVNYNYWFILISLSLHLHLQKIQNLSKCL
jgi:hypothetical protein